MRGMLSLMLLLGLMACRGSDSSGLDRVTERDFKAYLRSMAPDARVSRVHLPDVEVTTFRPQKTFYGDGLPDALGGAFAKPESAVWFGDTLVVADSKNNALVFLDEAGQVLGQMSERGEGPGEFVGPLLLTDNERFLFMYDNKNRRIQAFDRTWRYVGSVPAFLMPSNQIYASNSNLYVVEGGFNDDALVRVYAAEPPFEQRDAIVATPIKRSQQPNAFKNALVAGNAVGSVYVGLPVPAVVFELSPDHRIREVIHLDSPRIRRRLKAELWQKVPENERDAATVPLSIISMSSPGEGVLLLGLDGDEFALVRRGEDGYELSLRGRLVADEATPGTSAPEIASVAERKGLWYVTLKYYLSDPAVYVLEP